MTKEILEEANNLVKTRAEANERINILTNILALNEDKIDFTVVHRIKQFDITLTREDIEILIDHEEMKLGEYDRNFKEL